ncbi:MAG TPA: serine/threonine-protein kinase, partial [Gemmatimonadales bacterium]|nr:serine/threonine-protein kinase [Gemmatimonadales bacterium]
GMATVYLAHDVHLDRKVAIKVISHSIAQQADVAERFKREARTAGALSHPHIIPIHAVRQEEDLLYFVMKHVPGRSLDSVLAEVVPLPFTIVCAILSEVGAALDFAHRNGVIHRDIKPGNIMLDEEGFSVITDFGISKAAEGDGLTQAGTVVGTPAYVSPETCEGKPATAAADQYSLGVVAYQMLTGELPLQADSSMAMMYAQIHTPPEPLSKKRPDLPRDVNAAIMRMLEKKPEDRWPSVKDAVAAIATVAPPIDDDVRARIVALAKNRPDRGASEFWTPPSPAPRRTPSQPPEAYGERRVSGANTPPQIQIIHKVATWPMVVGGILALIAAGFYWQTRSEANAAQEADSIAASTTTMGDSLWLEARGKADLARQNALSAGVKALALASGDSLRALAESLAGAGQKAEGAVLLTQAVTAWQSVEATARRPAPSQPATALDSPVRATEALVPPESLPHKPFVTVPRVVTDSQGAAVLSDSQQVSAFYDRLAGFIAARQLGEMQRLRANMSSSEEQRWLDLFQDEKVEGVHVVFTILGVSAQAGRIYSRVRYNLAVTKGGKVETKRSTLRVELTRGPDGLREVKWEEAR